MKGEHVEHKIYLFYRKSQGLCVLIIEKTKVFILKTYAHDVKIKQIKVFLITH